METQVCYQVYTIISVKLIMSIIPIISCTVEFIINLQAFHIIFL